LQFEQSQEGQLTKEIEMKKLSGVLILVTMLSVLGAGCAPKIVGLDPSRWVLTELDGTLVSGTPEITLIFNGNRISGKDGCNQYGGEYELQGATFTVKPGLASTMMACDEAIMNQASAYTQLITKADTISLSGDTLTLTTSDSKKLVFTRQNTNLDGTTWNVTGYNNGQEAVVSLVADTQVTLEFGTDGKLAGNGGCNRYRGTFSTKDQTISIGALSSSKMMCTSPDGVMTQEALFLGALEKAAAYEVSGSTLDLFDADGARLVSLQKQ
jgi:heat shock protein HslJ